MLAPESPAMKDYQENVLQPRLEQSRKWKPSPGEKGNPDPVINIITDGRLASIDMRYHYPDWPSDPSSKLNILIDDVIVLHHRTADYPYIDKETGLEEPIKGAAQIVFYKLGFGKGVTRASRDSMPGPGSWRDSRRAGYRPLRWPGSTITQHLQLRAN